MKKFDHVELDEKEIEAINTIIEDFYNEDKAVRDRQIRTWKRLDYLWNGFTQVWWNSVAHDWRIYGFNADGVGDDDSNQAEYYDKSINVFRAYIETIIAALSNTVPPIKGIPDDADNPNDILTARGASKIGELVYSHIDAPLLWVRALWVYHLCGMVAAYNYTDEDEQYGSVDVREENDELVDGEQQVCPSCGTVLFERELSEGIAEIEKDEFDPGDDDIVLHDLLNKDQLLCPQCQMMIDPELRRDKVVITRLTGVTRQPKSRQCIEINGGLYVKVPNWARNQADCPYLSYDYETHYSNIYAKFPSLREKLRDLNINKITDSDGSNIYERWGRLNPQYNGEYPLNTPTVRNWWLRPCAFETLNDDDLRESLLEKFPDGCYAVKVNDEFVGACNESMDDHWTLSFNPMSNFVHYDAPGTLVAAVQEITSTLVSLELQCIEHSIPQTFFNPKYLNSEQYRNTEVTPGMMFPTKTVGENRNISDGFHTLQTATVSPELGPFGAKINEMGQFVSGALPQVWGGSSNASSRTASQYAMQRNGSQQRLSNLTGRTFNAFWKEIFSKVVPAYMKNMLEDERLVKELGDNNFVNVVIKKAQMDGKLGSIELAAPEGLAQSIDQIKETVMQLLQTNNPEILAAIGSAENLPTLSKVIGLTDFKIPGEDDREKQYEEIGLLLNSGPIPTPMGTEQSSIPPELMVDNHQIEAEICRSWLVGEKGRQAKTDNPEGYRNILLHLQEHMQMLQQLSAPPMLTGNPQGGNTVQPPAKDNIRQLRPVSREASNG